jgi:hypothetical protein
MSALPAKADITDGGLSHTNRPSRLAAELDGALQNDLDLKK